MTDIDQKVAQRKRIVLLHTQGPYRGLYQILGTSDALGGVLPPTTGEFTISPHTRTSHANLVKVKVRYALYRESDEAAAGGSFHESQQ